jgi:hypothetical protein
VRAVAERDELGDITDQGPWEREDEEGGTTQPPPDDELPPAADAS